MDINELRSKRKIVSDNSQMTIDNMHTIVTESTRVETVAHNSRQTLDNLDMEFETQTGLKGTDITFLFLATALQVAKIVIINQLTQIEKAGQGNSKEDALHSVQDKLLNRFNVEDKIDKPYYASLKHIVTTHNVPYDATAFLTSAQMNRGEWREDIGDYVTEKQPLFKGANHRFATLGHDPMLGLLFGTFNIMTNTITTVHKVGEIPVLSTNYVLYSLDFKDPKIGKSASTLIMLKEAASRTLNDPQVLVAALIKQIIHIGTDLYTPCGIQIPGANLVLSNTNVEKLTKIVSTGDLIKISASAKMSELINTLITSLYLLTFDKSEFSSIELFNVKSKKIIMYSNLIASTSNVIWVGANMAAGNESAAKQLDIGGLIVTMRHLISDTRYIRKVKEEFVFGGFDRMISGEDLKIKDIVLNE